MLGVIFVVNCRVLRDTICAVVLFNVIPVTSCLTVTLHVAVLLLPSFVFTVIVDVPTAFGVTNPEPFTVATFVLLLVQVTPLLLVVFGATVAVNCNVLPIFIVAAVLFNVTPVANCLTVTLHVAVLFVPSAVFTVIVAVPTAFGVTNPEPFTVATFVLLLVHVTPLLLVVFGVTVAVNCNVLPIFTVAVVWFNVIPVDNCLTVTLHVAVLLLPSFVFTVIVAVPTAFGVTKPDAFTVAIFVLLLVHITPLLFVESGATVAVNCNVLPIFIVAVVWFNVTPSANCTTVIAPDTVSFLFPALSIDNICR